MANSEIRPGSTLDTSGDSHSAAIHVEFGASAIAGARHKPPTPIRHATRLRYPTVIPNLRSPLAGFTLLLPFCCCLKKWRIFYSLQPTASRGKSVGGSPIFFGLPNLCDPSAVLEKLRRLMFSLPLHGFALFNHNQETRFCSDYSGLRPVYATQSHPKMLTLAHIQSLSGAKLRSGSEV